MPDVKELYREVTGQAPPRPDALERQRKLQARHTLNRRIQVFAVVAAAIVGVVFVAFRVSSIDRSGQPATPAATGPTVPPARNPVGFIGLPPEGATPSTPEHGELVLSFSGRSVADGGGLIEVWVYADGRLIWQQAGDFPFGANETRTGLLQQHLTPEGIELMRSEIVSTGLFDDRDLALLSGHVCCAAGIRRPVGVMWGSIRVREGDRLVRVQWSNPEMYPRDRGTVATPAEASALARLDALLTHPASWLPTSAWLSGVISAYVPSRYAVCYDPAERGITASRILDELPPSAGDLLRATAISGPGGATNCSNVTTEEARTLSRTFEEAGLDQDDRSSYGRLGYIFEPAVPLAPGPIENTVSISFEPILPNGEWTCSVCG